jgi:hypothetical protein
MAAKVASRASACDVWKALRLGCRRCRGAADSLRRRVLHSSLHPAGKTTSERRARGMPIRELEMGRRGAGDCGLSAEPSIGTWIKPGKPTPSLLMANIRGVAAKRRLCVAGGERNPATMGLPPTLHPTILNGGTTCWQLLLAQRKRSLLVTKCNSAATAIHNAQKACQSHFKAISNASKSFPSRF